MQNFTDSIITSWFDHWLSEQPVFSWLIFHPLMSSIVIIFSISIFWKFLKMIAKAIDNLWTIILKTPWLLIKWLFGAKINPSHQLK